VSRALPLSARVALAAAATLSAALASYGFVVHGQLERVLLQVTTRGAVAAASDAADGVVHHLLLGDYAGAEELLQRLARNRDVTRITLVDPRGGAIAEVARAAAGEPPRATQVPEAVRPPERVEVTVETGPDAVVVWHPVRAQTVLGWVRLVNELDALHAVQRATATDALVLAAIWSAAATVLLLALLRRPVVSIRRLAEFARGLGAHRGEPVAVPSSSPEIVQLAAALDEASRGLREGEARLLAERQLLAVTLRSITDGVVATDRGGRVVLTNDAAERLAGCSADRALGRRFADVFSGLADGGAVPPGDPIAQVLAAGRPSTSGSSRSRRPGAGGSAGWRWAERPSWEA
jgi:PAS domain-containing protein